jgi:flagellar motor switch protein FliG
MKRTTTPFKFLAKVSNESILNAIVAEHPQTIAVIVACLQPTQAAYIIECLPPERQLAVLMRVASMRQIDLTFIKIVEEELKMQKKKKKFINIGGTDTVAEVLTVINQETGKYIMGDLVTCDKDLADEIGQSMRVVQTIRQMEKNGKITVNK